MDTLNANQYPPGFATSIVNTAPVIVLLLDTDGNIDYANPYFEKLSGFLLDEIKGKPWISTFLPERDHHTIESLLKSSIAEESVRGKINPIIIRNGEEREIEWYAETMSDDKGKVTGVLSIGQDVTQQKKAEAEILASKESLNEAQRLAKIGSWELNLDTNHLFWSDEIYRIFEIDKQQFGSSYEAFLNAIHPEDRELVNQAYTDSLSTKQPYEIRHRLIMGDGRIKHVVEACETTFDDVGKALYSMGTIQDITKIKQIENENEKNHSRFMAMFQSIADAIVYVDTDRIIQMVNAASIKMFGYDESELIGKNMSMLYASIEEFEQQGKEWSNRKQNTKGLIDQVTYRRKNGENFIGESVDSAFQYSNESIQGFVRIIRDVTQRNLTEKKIREQSEIIDQIHDGVVSTDLQGIIQSWNKGAEKLFGYSSSEALGQNINFIYPKEMHASIKNEMFPTLLEKGNLEEERRLLKKSHETVYIHLSLSLIYDNDNIPIGMIGYSLDITERMKTRFALEKSEDRYRVLTKVSPVGIFRTDIQGKCIHVNEYCCDMAGLSETVLLENGWICAIHPEDRGRVFSEWHLAVMENNSFTTEARIQRPDGEIKWVMIKAEAELNSDYEVMSYVGAVSDISKRIQSERKLEEYREQLEDKVVKRTQAMKQALDKAKKSDQAKSDFLSRMSHELRTPLNSILGFGRLLELESADKSETTKENINEILEAGNHLLLLINEVLDLSRIQSGNLEITKQEVNVNHIIQKSIALMSPLATSASIEVIEQLESKELTIKIDPSRFKQILVNLLSNAVKYNCKNGNIIIRSEISDEKIRISIIDTGEGLTDNEIKKLFIPFERLNKLNNVEGVGIGLVITKNLVELMGGVIGVESVPGEGSNFWIEFALKQQE